MTALALAFAAGLLSILSPCVLPLVPIVLGTAASAHPLGALALAAGLAISFTGLGLLLALAGFGLRHRCRHVSRDRRGNHDRARRGPAGSVVAGAAGRGRQSGFQLGGAALRRLRHIGLAGQFAIGLLLGAVWSPCVGPTLGAASLLASQGRDLPQVALTMAVFGIGAALPLIVLGLLSRATLIGVRSRLMSAGKARQGPARRGLHRDRGRDRLRRGQAHRGSPGRRLAAMADAIDDVVLAGPSAGSTVSSGHSAFPARRLRRVVRGREIRTRIGPHDQAGDVVKTVRRVDLETVRACGGFRPGYSWSGSGRCPRSRTAAADRAGRAFRGYQRWTRAWLRASIATPSCASLFLQSRGSPRPRPATRCRDRNRRRRNR